MKYFLHVNYKEGITGGWFCKKRNYLKLVSIAIVSESGEEFNSSNHPTLPHEVYLFLRDGRIAGEELAELYSYRPHAIAVAFRQLFQGVNFLESLYNKSFYDLKQELDRVNATFDNDYSLWESSDMPFQKDELEGMSAIQKARKYKELYEFLEAKK